MKTLLIAAFTLLSAAGFAQQVQTGTLGRIYDGDTYEIKTKTRAGADTSYTARGSGYDTPESLYWYLGDKVKQPGGQYVSDTTRTMLRGQAITFRIYGKDQFDRPLVVIYFNGERLDALLIRLGLAWYESGAPKGAVLPNGKGIQQAAQAAGRGIFNKARFPGRAIRPSTFRYNHRKK